MRVKIIRTTPRHDADGYFKPGDTPDVDEGLARDWIRMGKAVDQAAKAAPAAEQPARKAK